ncbi:hypothetical protein Chor_016272, partial [Crotalus horridus]
MAPQSGASAGKPETEPGVPRLFTWEEVGLRTGKGNFKKERWLVINRKVYDVSQFYLRHPGGLHLIRHYSGQDATEMLVHDFHELRTKVEKMGLLKSSVPFFAVIFLHAFLLDVASWFTVWYFGKTWVPFFIGVTLFTVSQIQYGFFQHDLGHISVFQKPKWNRLAQTFVIVFLK